MTKRRITPEDLLRIQFVADAQWNPSGDRILFQHKAIVRNKSASNLATVDLDGNVRFLTRGEKGAGQGRWIGDGHYVGFQRTDEDGNGQVFLLPADGGESYPLTNLPPGSIGRIEWSPDGTHVALAFRPAAPDRTKAAEKDRESHRLSTPPWVIDDIWYRLDGDGYFGGQRYAIHILRVDDLAKGVATEIGVYRGAPDGIYSFSWAPDSASLVVAHTAETHPFRSKPNDQLYIVQLDGSGTRVPGLPRGEKSEPRISPDGQWIAYAGDTDEDDPWGTRNTKIYLVPFTGGEPRDLTGHQDFDMQVATLSDTAEAAFNAVLRWRADGSGLYTQVGHQGETQVGFVSVSGGVELLTAGHHALVFGSADPLGRVAVAYSTPTQIPEIAVVQPELGTGNLVPKLLTDFNHDLMEELHLVAPESVWVESTDGARVHTWILRHEDDPTPAPTCLNVHGGPHTQYGWTFFLEFQVQAAQGYTVAYSNPRGSKGYGEAWCAAIRGDWGNKDWADVEAVTRYLQNHPAVDANRIAIMGGSYGGYMTNWAIGHSKAYKAAITDRCVSNMVSMAGNSDFPFNKDGYFKGVAWGSLEDIRELWRQSPIAYFEGVTTPTLVIHSEGDLRCNVEQGEQVFTALQQQGVPSRFVRYPSTTSHGMSRSGPPDLRLHRLGEYLNWLEKWL